MTNALASVRSGYRPSAGRATRRMNQSRARPRTTPMTTPTLICRTNWPATDSRLPAVIPPAASKASMRAMPTGSLAPDSPSRMSPLRPATSRRPSTENTTAGSVGETAVPSRAARYQSSPKAKWASTAAAAAAVLAHFAFGLDWYLAALLGTAVSPTDPAVVFSVLGRREVAGRSGDILEGESGANDPVGIALMLSLIHISEPTRRTPISYAVF